MKPIFKRKIIREGKTTTHAIWVDGFTDDTGRERAKIVISAITGSHNSLARRDSQLLCASLNKAWTDFYNGVR